MTETFIKDFKVSIIVTCYNYGLFISECLTSLKNQTFIDWECIVIDDGSTDNSKNEVSKFMSDKRFSYFSQANSGVANSRNLGISKAKGEYLLMLDADDKLTENSLEIMISYFERYPDATLITPTVEFFGSKSGIWELPEYSYNQLLVDNMIVLTSMFKKSELDSAEGYDVFMKEGSEDWELWIRMLNPKSQVIKTMEVLFHYRIKPESRNTTILNSKAKKFDVYRYITKKHAQIYTDHFESPLVLFHQVEAFATEKNHIIDHPLEFWANRLRAKIKRKISGL